jgi:cleavage stimulation factor subunit 2
MNSTTVNIGKFPFDYTEQQVLEIAKSVGPVELLKLMFDEMTGKSKGNAIVKFKDAETAASAVRNLDYMTLPNGRFLRCTFTSEAASASNNVEKLPMLPLGVQINTNQLPNQTISTVVSSIDANNALQVLKDAKSMTVENPRLTKLLFDSFPQLAHALVELTLLTNTSNRDLVELTLNKKQIPFTEVTIDHANLLREVAGLGDEDISSLDDAKKDIIMTLKEEIKKGSFGQVV